jgi:hypothetical protein
MLKTKNRLIFPLQITFTAKYVAHSNGRFGAWSDVYVNDKVSPFPINFNNLQLFFHMNTKNKNHGAKNFQR